MSLGLAALLSFLLIALLFTVAWLVEARTVGRAGAMPPRLRHMVYTLGLGVYCSSWTFYGAVGSVVREGWNYLPIYLAPCLLLLAAPGFLGRLGDAVAAEKAATISDFIAARFGHDIGMARLVTLTALSAIVPYVALQLRSIGIAIALLSDRAVAAPVMVAAALVLGLFAILFGARRYEVAGRTEGLLFSIALESVIKMVALVVVAGVAIAVIAHAPRANVAQGYDLLRAHFRPSALSVDFLVIGLVSALAVVVLPRQFFMGLAQAHGAHDLRDARLGAAGYIAAMAVLIVPIALGGLVALPGDGTPDLFVLRLPAATGYDWAVIAALSGGISSAAAMVIVDTTALAIMVSNDLIFPTVLRTSAADMGVGQLGRRMMGVRRLAIMAVMSASLAWALLLPAGSSLASIGLIAFAGMAQFSPHFLLAVYGKGRDPVAGRWSLGAGFALWLWTLALPPILPPSWLAGLLGTPFDPLHLFGLGHASALVHGVLWSLSVNGVVLFAMSAARDGVRVRPNLLRGARHVRNQGELAQLAARFVGEQAAETAFPPALHNAPVDRKAARQAQDLIASVVGPSSARALVASALAGGQMGLDDVTRLLDEGGQSLRFSRSLLAASFENLPSGISVIDGSFNLVAWNSRYVDLFGYPPGLVRAGVPVADLIRFNIVRSGFSGTIEAEVDRRLARLRARQPYVSERIRQDGRVIKSVGGPMPGGGYLTSFTDITAETETRDELERTLEQLETRVAERTQALSQANRRLAESTRDKTRFLAAASHDLLQPLHAARLFLSALDRQTNDAQRVLVGRVERAIVAAEALLRALLDISRLDAGGIQPHPEPIALAPFLRDIAEGVRPLAEQKGLRLIIGPLFGVVRTDAGLLRSVVQNLLSNAVRYTERGSVLIGVRRRGHRLRIDVVDSGVGIPQDQRSAIFGEFTRLGTVEAEGLGLGLAMVERIARLLDLGIDVASSPGRGSRFGVTIAPTAAHVAPVAMPIAQSADPVPLRAMTVLVVDNDKTIIEASEALFAGQGHRVLGAGTIADALALADQADAALIDYNLDRGETGLDLIDTLQRTMPHLALALISAAQDPALRMALRRRGVPFYAKPVDPALLAEFIATASKREVEPQ
ncbi:PAS-domain containing protein [Novosphingobium sp. FSW06-99]|uniref:PAS-domain containing protein n=1 Tax=Novosphingobium sp. FSW06-99 TaxID=1739113 RepID=UPI00076C2539|nr:PAS-domain containing protein [Novosphingobium sp. FSW06-99]KUR76910.1 histidine kinase [Novosphingobium sp. FSW06-99]